MLYVEIANITTGLEQDGKADYVVVVHLNYHKTIWAGTIKSHVRTEGAAKLLRLIADAMEKKTGCEFCDAGDKPTNGRHYIFDSAVSATHSHTCKRKRS